MLYPECPLCGLLLRVLTAQELAFEMVALRDDSGAFAVRQLIYQEGASAPVFLCDWCGIWFSFGREPGQGSRTARSRSDAKRP